MYGVGREDSFLRNPSLHGRWPGLWAACLLGMHVCVAPVQAAVSNAVPRLVSPEPVHHFGTVDNREGLEHRFALKNEGDAPLVIDQVKPSCGCTLAELSHTTIPAGGEAELVAKLDLSRRRGEQKLSIRIDSNDPEHPQYWLYLKGYAESDLRVEPDKIYFGVLKEGERPRERVELELRGGDTFTLTSVESSSTNFAVEVKKPLLLKRGRRYRLVISPVGLTPGAFNGNIRVRTDHEEYPVVDIPVSATVLDHLMVAPQDIVLDRRQAEPVSRFVVVRAGLVQGFAITNVVAPDPSIGVDVMEMGENAYRIRLSNLVADDALDGKPLRIFTDVEAEPELEVPFHVIPPRPAPGSS